MNANGVLAAQEAWVRLMKCRFAPTFAYRLAKYAKEVSAEILALEEQKMVLLQRYGEEITTNTWSVKPTSEKFGAFMAEYAPLLETETDLKPCSFTMELILDELNRFPENGIEPGYLELLEPFFANGELSCERS